MKNKLKTLILGGLVTGALLATTGQAFANDYWHWSKEHNRWDVVLTSEATIMIWRKPNDN